MQPNKAQKSQVFKSMYRKSVQGSYFQAFKGNRAIEQSKIQSIKRVDEQEVDENTFRIMTNFQAPDNSYAVYEKSGTFYIEEQGFFSCISSRKKFQVQLKNFKLTVLERTTRLKYFFNFETDNATIESKGNHILIQIDSCAQKFVFYPVEEKKAEIIVDDWVSLINKVIHSSDAKKHKFNYLSAKLPTFYTQYHVSNDEFQKSANTLDVILFRSPHSAASIQRLFTNSQYDHVGVILRNKKNELYVFESTSNEGVGLTPWKDLIRYQWYNSTDKIAWRRFNIKLTQRDIQVIQAYVAKTLGKEFQISLDKFFMFSSKLQRSKEEEANKTYFCSQLVARLYKEIGLLDQKKSSTSYYPVDFSEKVQLNISKQREKAYLQPQRVISFNFVKK